MKFPALPLARAFALVGLALAFSLLFALLVLSLPGMAPATMALFDLDRPRQAPSFTEGQTVVLILATLAIVLSLAGRRRLRSWRWLGGALALVVFVSSLLILTLPRTVATATTIMNARVFAPDWPSFGAGVDSMLLVLTLPAMLYAAWRFRRCPWWSVGCAYVLVASIFAYFANDDPSIRRPLSIEQIAPAFPGDETSYAVLMRYGQSHPLNQNFKVPVQLGQYPNFTQTAATRAWLNDNRDKISTNWTALAPVRAWWTELNTFGRIGDLTPLRIDAEIIGFHAVREMAMQASEMAGLQTLDGQGDAALDTLLPVVEVAGKLESSGRTSVRLFLARTTRRLAVDSAGFVLDTTPVSPAARARFAAALAAGEGGEAGVRRIFDLDYVWGLNWFLDRPLGEQAALSGPMALWFKWPLNLFSAAVYNPRHTANLQGEILAEMQEMAARRQLDLLTAYDKAVPSQQGRLQFKNVIGSLWLAANHPSISTVVGVYWKEEDQRAALLTRLGQP